MAASLDLRQASFPDMCLVSAAVDEMAALGGIEERGAIFTRREIVDFILDLSGYVANKPLHELSLLEPSFGDGDFLIPAIERLLSAWQRSGSPAGVLINAIRGVELHRETFEHTKALVISTLKKSELAADDAKALAESWLIQGDFLLTALPLRFDVVIGNPPYVRQELIPGVLLDAYRTRFRTMYDRADLYIPFIEKSLSLLKHAGVLGFICADRWMKNKYGGPLRAMVAKDFHLRALIDMTGVQAFHVDVIAYPAITVIAREKAGTTRIAHSPAVDALELSELAKAMTAHKLLPKMTHIRELTNVVNSSDPWILDSEKQTDLLRRLERDFPALEEAGCKVGIGVATGADKAFIGPFDELDVEPERKQPLAMTRDIQTGRVVWRGLGVVNPFKDGPGSGLVNLDDYPRLKRYLEARKPEIAGRHVAQRAPANWYRTIDRITESLTSRPKLLIPDIKGSAQIVYEEGKLYPHHNLYYVTSDTWDLKALQAILLSDVARLFVASYSTKMRGGFLRFQAQYLRRIRLPLWETVSPMLRAQLTKAAEALDIEACNQAAMTLYALTLEEREILRGGEQKNGTESR